MIMRRLLMAAVVLTAIPLFSAGGNHRYYDGHGRHSGNMSVNIDDEAWYEGGPTDCSQLRVTFDDEPVAVSTEEVPVGNLRSLSVRSDQNGGIHVVGTS